MEKKRYFITFFVWLLVCLGVIAWQQTHQNIVYAASIGSEYVHSKTPTIYVHGFGGGAGSTDQMIVAAEKSHAATKAITATVSPNGKGTFSGVKKFSDNNPIVQVNFKNNRDQNIKDAGKWLDTVLIKLKKDYHVTSFNAVGHSYGNNAIVTFAELYGRDKNVPKLKKYVSIAGSFNGIVSRDDKPNQNYLEKNGKPHQYHAGYQALLDQRKGFPSGVSVLNIYGNKEGGTNSDGAVTMTSARSLGYVLRGETKSYKELEVKGKNAQHSRLHENNKTVDNAVINFIWKK